MTRKESEALQVGDRVFHSEDKVNGVVADVGYRAITVTWDDGQTGQIAHADSSSIERSKP